MQALGGGITMGMLLSIPMALVGAGAIGCAIAREISQRCAAGRRIEAPSDVLLLTLSLVGLALSLAIQGVLSAVAVAGIILVVYEPTAIGGHAVGVAVTVVGIACCAAYTVITRRFLPDAQETSQVVLWQQGTAPEASTQQAIRLYRYSITYLTGF